MYMGGGKRNSPLEFSKQDREALELLDSTPGKINSATETLKDSFLKFVDAGSDIYWSFKHPTISDAFSELVSKSPNLIEIYIIGTRTEKQLQEIVCGDIDIDGANVKISPKYYDTIIKKLDEPELSTREVYYFLSYRCDKKFLERFIKLNPGVFEKISDAKSYLYVFIEFRLLSCLHEFGLLPEHIRKNFIKGVKRLAVQIPDAGFLSLNHIRNLINDDEIEEILSDVREHLIPEIYYEIDNWKFNYNTDENPDNYFEELIDALKEYKKAFDGELELEEQIEGALNQIEDITEELRDEYYSNNPEPEYDGESGYGYSDINGERNIFDDIDH